MPKQLPNGTWQGRHYDDAGKQQTRNGFRLKRDAVRWENEQKTAVASGRYVDPLAGRATFREFYDEWAQRQVWEHTTRRGMNNTVRHLTFGDVPLSQIKRSHIESWVKAMTATLAASTIKTRMANVRSVFHAAIADKVIVSDPSADVRTPGVRRKEYAIVIPTPEQVRSIMLAANERFRPFIAICAFAGLRHGETAAVQLGDVDFLRRTLHVTRQAQHGDGGLEIRPPKHGSERDVYVPDDLLELLSAVPGHGSEQWLFVGTNQMPPGKTAIGYHWDMTLLAAGLATETKVKNRQGKLVTKIVKSFVIHDLRHFYASGLIAAGCDVVTVQRALGHKSASVTLGTYSHLWSTAEDRTRNAAAGMWRDAFKDVREDDLRTLGEPSPL